VALAGDRPYATMAAIAIPALVLIVERASNLTVLDLGAIVLPVDGEWWRYFAAPFVYEDLGYLFAVGLALAIFLPALEERIGSAPALLLVAACGALGALASAGLDSALADGIPVTAGGNGIALGVLGAWLALRDAERRRDPTEEYDQIAVAVAAVVLLLLPLVEDFASAWAGLAGGLVGLACGFSAGLRRGSPR
jgi:membrane associated rhomboid family serine protease